MIEKLDTKEIKKDCGAFGVITVGRKLATEIETQDKINELVDAVNELQNMKVQVNDHEIRLTTLDDPTGLTPADPYAEQRKWIGKLCRFWNFDGGSVDLGILKSIDELKHAIPYINDIDCSYAFCEPVKPDDDIIFKGE